MNADGQKGEEEKYRQVRSLTQKVRRKAAGGSKEQGREQEPDEADRHEEDPPLGNAGGPPGIP